MAYFAPYKQHTKECLNQIRFFFIYLFSMQKRERRVKVLQRVIAAFTITDFHSEVC